MTKHRYTVPGGGKFKTYEEAEYFVKHSTVCSSVQAPDEIQIRKTAAGFKVMVRREVE